MPRTIQDQVNKTYFSLRLAAAVIAFAFPIILYVGGRIAGFGLRDSMSAYYHASPRSLVGSKEPCTAQDSATAPIAKAGTMRNAFVGLLFAIGAILYVNKGHTDRENILLNIAGVLAWCIAIFPMPWACKPPHHVNPHGVFAISFFVVIAFIAIVCPRDTVRYLPIKRQAFYLKLYKTLGSLMLLSPLFAYLANETILGRESYAFGIEVFGIYAFAGYWIVKTREIKEIQSERERQKGILKHAESFAARPESEPQIPKELFF